MFSLNRPKTDENAAAKAARRLSDRALQSMMDMGLNQAGRALLLYTQEGDHTFLDEAEEGAAALLASIRELKTRRI